MINDAFFKKLKRDTSGSHKHLELTYPFSTLMRVNQFDQLSYQHVLLTMNAFHHALESFPPGFHQEGLSELLNAKETMGALRKDLAILTTENPPINPLSLSSDKDDIHALIAYAYVWAGSSMGAKILIKWLEKQNIQALPTSYYHQMAKQSANWVKVKEYISECLNKETLQPDNIIDQANKWFNAIMQHAKVSYAFEARETIVQPATL